MQTHIITSGDISAQEPTFITLISKEPEFFPVFRNRMIRELGLESYLSRAFELKYGFNSDKYSKMSALYWTWLQQFHWNWTPLMEFNEKIIKLKNGGDMEGEIEEYLIRFFNSFDKFVKDNSK